MHLYPRLQATRKTGAEPLRASGRPLGVTLLDFWQWSASDLVSNATRGRLAEFIVATAIEDLDAVFVTHAHHDHIGGLMHLYGELGYDGAWYAHPIRIRCTDLALRDSVHLQGRGGEGLELVNRVMANARECHPGEAVAVADAHVTPLDAGHVRGSLQFLIEAQAPTLHRTLVTGDINTAISLSVPPFQLPDLPVGASIDMLVVEGTNAFRDERVMDGRTGSQALITELELQTRWPVLLPVMSLGRAQEVIAALAGSRWDVGVFGLAARMTEATEMSIPANVTLDSRPARLIPRDRYDVLVASAGCLQGGPSRYFWDEANWDVSIILRGHLFPGTPAHAHAAAWPRVRYSGHVSGEAWTGFVSQCAGARRFLVHFPGDRKRAAACGFVVPMADRIYCA